MSVRVYTDGACSDNGFGGWAALLVAEGVLVDGRYGAEKDTTNNKMELRGLIEGMRMLPTVVMSRCKNCGVVPHGHFDEDTLGPHADCLLLGQITRPVYQEAILVSDSQYCVEGAKNWVHLWQVNGWKTKQKQPVKNQSEWEQIIQLSKRTGAGFEWVKGHSGDYWNELVDEWAVTAKMKLYGGQPFVSKIPEFD
jgi:ribonuclease HI